MTEMSRRKVMHQLTLGCAGVWLGCQKNDRFAQELVCIHIYHPEDSIPASLLGRRRRPSASRPAQEFFHIGLPELLVCTAKRPFLGLFQYFWPFSQEDFRQFREAMTIEFQKPILAEEVDVESLADFLRQHKNSPRFSDSNVALVLTFNEFTRYWASDVVELFQEGGVDELVLFKDPSHPPYLCDFPSQQKGFKRPPP